LLTNQTNITANLGTGSVTHAISGGIEFIDEEQYNPTYVGLGTPITPANLYHPDHNDVQPGYAPVRNGVFTRGETQTAGVYVFDTVSFAERWQATAGFRVDSFDTDFDSAALSTLAAQPTLPVGTLIPASLSVKDTLFSYKVGLVFKPSRNGSVYLSHAISEQPPGGSNFTLSTAANNVNNPNLDPQKGTNLELGTKWEFRDGALAVTGAVYDSKNENELTPDPVDPTLFIQLGEREVKGVELGIVGKITDNWEMSAGVASMDTEIKRGLANQAGNPITWSPKLTFTSWTTYHTPFGLSIGGGFRYVDSVIRPISSNAAPPPPNQTTRLLGHRRDGGLFHQREDLAAAERLQPDRRVLHRHAEQQRRALFAGRSALRAAHGELHVLVCEHPAHDDSRAEGPDFRAGGGVPPPARFRRMG
jgi:catecholate siderophore receptor